jgi:Ca-activated chloride channel family protein
VGITRGEFATFRKLYRRAVRYLTMRPGVILLAASLAFAQNPAPTAIRVDVALVNVAFTARDAHGRLVTDLTRDEIEVLEDGVGQPIQFFGRSADLPLEFAILLDMSGSQERFNQVHREDLASFAQKALMAGDKALLVCFANRMRVATDFTSSAADLLTGLDRYSKNKQRTNLIELEPDDTRTGGTALFDAIYYTASLKMMEPGARKAVLVFSDGEDNSSARDVIEAIEAAQSANALIYTVRFTELRHGVPTARNRYGLTEMNRLAADTGGLAFDAAHTDVGAALTLVSAELRSLYEIGFATSNPSRDGSFRKLQLRCKRPGVTIRARSGYYAR